MMVDHHNLRPDFHDFKPLRLAVVMPQTTASDRHCCNISHSARSRHCHNHGHSHGHGHDKFIYYLNVQRIRDPHAHAQAHAHAHAHAHAIFIHPHGHPLDIRLKFRDYRRLLCFDFVII